MKATIDFQQSIISERLIYRGTFRQLLWIYFSSFAGCVGTLVFFYLLVINTIYKNYTILAISLLLLLTVFTSVSTYFINKLYVIKVPKADLNISNLTKFLKDNYNNIKFDNSSSKILIGQTKSSFWAFDRSFTVLYNDEYLGMNISVVGRGDIKYCLLSMYNYYKCRELLKSLR